MSTVEQARNNRRLLASWRSLDDSLAEARRRLEVVHDSLATALRVVTDGPSNKADNVDFVGERGDAGPGGAR